MKTPTSVSRLCRALALFVLVLAWSVTASRAATLAGPPQLMAYQGYLTDGNGIALGATNTGPKNYNVVFRIWSIQSGGTISSASELYAEQQTVTVNNGYFSVMLGQGSSYNGEPYPAAGLSSVFSSTNSTRYVEISLLGVGTGGAAVTIAPRMQLIASPYSFLAASAVYAATAGTLVNTTNSATVVAVAPATGYVGIGTASPAQELEVNGNEQLDGSLYLPNAANIYAKNTAGNYEQCLVPRWSDNVTYFNYGSGGLNIRNDSATSTMFLSNGGNVGIGTVAPAQTLEVNGNAQIDATLTAATLSATTISATTMNPTTLNAGTLNASTLSVVNANASQTLYGGWLEVGGAPGSIPNQGTYVEWNRDNGGGGSWFLNQRGVGAGGMHFGDVTTGNAFSEYVTILGAGSSHPGYVGIGTTAPAYPLEVEASTWGTLTESPLGIKNSYGWEQMYSGGGLGTSGGVNTPYDQSWTMGIYTAQGIAGGVIVAFSDARIKNIIGLSDGAADLAKLKQIEITNFKYKDEATHSRQTQKKVIAQQVEKVYPQAVSRGLGVIPDIFKLAQVKNGWVQLATDLKSGERVRLVTPEGAKVYEVLAVTNGAFQVDLATGAPQLFVYGREVHDFRTVDYDAIAMLNVSATQELARRLEQVEARESRVAELEQQAGEVATLEAQVADLKKMVLKLAAANGRTQTAEEDAPAATGSAGAKPMVTASRVP